MTPPSLIIVAGLGRCGTSAVMEMLDAAGVPIHHDGKDVPKFESDDVMRLPGDAAWLDDLAPGTALKIIGPEKYLLPKDRPYRFIVMTRNRKQQARSIRTFQAIMRGRDLPLRTQQAGLSIAEPAAIREIRSHGHGSTILRQTFEMLINNPGYVAGTIASFLGLPTDAIPKMAAVVWKRDARHQGRMLEMERARPDAV